MSYQFLSIPQQQSKKLYKYFSKIDYAIDSIEKQRIHLDNPEKFNDPFDATYQLHSYVHQNTESCFYEIIDKALLYLLKLIDTQDVSSYTLHLINLKYQLSAEQLEKTYKCSIQEVLKEIYSLMINPSFSFDAFCEAIDLGYSYCDGLQKLNCKISCFSEVWDSVLMWSYYANCHNGVCIEYDLSMLDLNDELNLQILNHISKVQYSPIRSIVPDNTSNPLSLVLSKASAWSHEHEWRIVCQSSHDFLPFNCISGVYLGVNFNNHSSEINQDIIRSTLLFSNANIYQCRLSPKLYKIEKQLLMDNTYGKALIKSLYP